MHPSTILFALAPFVAALAGFLGYRWMRRDHLKERTPWLSMLAAAAKDAADSGAVGALEGIVIEQGEPLVAPFSGRSCLGYTLEIITRETFGNRTTWNRAYAWGEGHVVLADANGAPAGEAALAGAKAIFPPDLMSYGAFSASRDTVFQGAPNAIPQHLAAFLERLPPAVRRLVWDPTIPLLQSKRIIFNERVIVPGSAVVAVGPASRADGALIVSATDDQDIYVGFGTRESERDRVAKVPIGEWIFGIGMAAVLAGALIAMVASVLSPKSNAAGPGNAVTAPSASAGTSGGTESSEEGDDGGSR